MATLEAAEESYLEDVAQFEDLLLVSRAIGSNVPGATVEPVENAGIVSLDGKTRSWCPPGSRIGLKDLDKIRELARTELREAKSPKKYTDEWDPSEPPSLRAAGEDDELGALLSDVRSSADRSVVMLLGALQAFVVLDMLLEIASAARPGVEPKVAVVGAGEVGVLVLRVLFCLREERRMKVAVATAHPLRAEYDVFRDADFLLVRDPVVVLESADVVVLSHANSVRRDLVPALRGAVPSHACVLSLLGDGIGVEMLSRDLGGHGGCLALSLTFELLDEMVEELVAGLGLKEMEKEGLVHLEPYMFLHFETTAEILGPKIGQILAKQESQLFHTLIFFAKQLGLSDSIANAVATSAIRGKR